MWLEDYDNFFWTFGKKTHTKQNKNAGWNDPTVSIEKTPGSSQQLYINILHIYMIYHNIMYMYIYIYNMEIIKRCFDPTSENSLAYNNSGLPWPWWSQQISADVCRDRAQDICQPSWQEVRYFIHKRRNSRVLWKISGVQCIFNSA